jgi:DNA-directed RNA polymerase specialized sigma24 family protein
MTPSTLRSALADASIRRGIHSVVGRSIPPQEVGDVVHEVLCDALAAADPPPAEDVPRWLYGIARHKVADHHRRASRRSVETTDPASVGDRRAPLEARSLLRGIVAETSRDPRGAQTMAWIAREAAGERLDEIAREASLPAATVRQRVSRLRRWLRKRWQTEAMLVLAAGLSMLALAVRLRPVPSLFPIVADPAADSAPSAGAALQGRWRLVDVEPDGSLDTARRALLDANARTTSVEVTGSVLRISSAYHGGERRLEVGSVAGGRFALRITEAGGAAQGAWAQFDPKGRLVVTSTDGDWRGRATLERVVGP